MAPVTTTGRPGAMRRSSMKAVSSIVSVPCTKTTPSIPSPARVVIRRATSLRCASVSDAPGSWNGEAVSISARRARPGTTETSSSADKLGSIPPDGLRVMAMVPPIATTRTRLFDIRTLSLSRHVARTGGWSLVSRRRRNSAVAGAPALQPGRSPVVCVQFAASPQPDEVGTP